MLLWTFCDVCNINVMFSGCFWAGKARKQCSEAEEMTDRRAVQK